MPEDLVSRRLRRRSRHGEQADRGCIDGTVGFLGVAERGPTTPTFIASATDYFRAFGSYYKDAQHHMT